MPLLKLKGSYPGRRMNCLYLNSLRCNQLRTSRSGIEAVIGGLVEAEDTAVGLW